MVSPSLSRIKDIFRPASENALRSLLKEYKSEAELIAGGTDLLVKPEAEVKYLIDLSGVGLDYLKAEDEWILIGAMTNVSSLISCEFFDKDPHRIVKSAASVFGTMQTRNRATIGGNICSAVPSADLPIALIALDAQVEIAGDENRTMLLEDFLTGYRQTALEEHEYLREIRISRHGDKSRSAFQKLCRTSVDLALVNCAVRLNSSSSFRDSRIVLGAVAPTPIRARNAERRMDESQVIDKDLISDVSDLASRETKPISDVRASAEYRRAMSKVLVDRALKQALGW